MFKKLFSIFKKKPAIPVFTLSTGYHCPVWNYYLTDYTGKVG